MYSRKKVESLLRAKGAKVIGDSEDYGYAKGGLIVSGEEMDGLFDYYGESVIGNHEFGISMKIVDMLDEAGWYAEWYDPGTLIVIPD